MADLIAPVRKADPKHRGRQARTGIERIREPKWIWRSSFVPVLSMRACRPARLPSCWKAPGFPALTLSPANRWTRPLTGVSLGSTPWPPRWPKFWPAGRSSGCGPGFTAVPERPGFPLFLGQTLRVAAYFTEILRWARATAWNLGEAVPRPGVRRNLLGELVALAGAAFRVHWVDAPAAEITPFAPTARCGPAPSAGPPGQALVHRRPDSGWSYAATRDYSTPCAANCRPGAPGSGGSTIGFLEGMAALVGVRRGAVDVQRQPLPRQPALGLAAAGARLSRRQPGPLIGRWLSDRLMVHGPARPGWWNKSTAISAACVPRPWCWTRMPRRWPGRCSRWAGCTKPSRWSCSTGPRAAASVSLPWPPIESWFGGVLRCRQLLRWGVPADRIVITGSPWHDDLDLQWQAAREMSAWRPASEDPGRRPPRLLLLNTMPPRNDRPDAISLHLTGSTYAEMLRATCARRREPQRGLDREAPPARTGRPDSGRGARDVSRTAVAHQAHAPLAACLAQADLVLSCGSSTG